MPLQPRQQRLLEIETARMRHAWAKAQVESGNSTPALKKYLRETLNELAAFKASHTRIDHSYQTAKE
jgi:hypothetical protein